jgi:tRNA(Ile)-lysidine synthase
MNKISRKIKSFLEKYDLEKSDLVYIVAFSGGFDSMCLLDNLKNITKNKIVAVHLNHKWRGQESDLEEENCKNFCEKIGVDFYSENIPPQTPKTETAAREARYEFFKNCAKKFDSKIVFTAHNKNDNAETLIYRIAMGTGVVGLQGIGENRDIFYRPLLDISRQEIEKYCQTNHLVPNFDSSNLDVNYKRNYIRANVLPQLAKLNPDVVDKMSSLSEIAKEENEIVEEYLNFIYGKICENGKIKTNKYLKLSLALQKRIIYKIFLENNLDYDRKKITRIWEFLQENSTKKSGTTCSLTDNLWIFVNEDFIQIITKNEKIFPEIRITKEGKYETESYIFEIEKFVKQVKKFPKDSENIAYVNLNFPINFDIRTRQNGDIITPLGLDGKQKFKKYLNSKKIPNHQKDSIILMAQDNEILWAIGVGISDKIKVESLPTHRIKFSMK